MVLKYLGWIPVAIAFRDLVIDAGFVGDKEMVPVLNNSYLSEAVVIDKMAPRTGDFRRGDVVGIKSNNSMNRFIFRRLIALEGDWVLRQDDSYVHVSKGHCWVENETDGKGESIPLAAIGGRALAVLWPPHCIRTIKTSKDSLDRVKKRSRTRPYTV